MSRAILSGGLLFGYCKGYTLINNVECPLDIQLQTAGVLAASKYVVDMSLEDPIQRAVAAGSLFAGGMFVGFKDSNWFRWVALGTAASYIADLVLPEQKSQSNTNE